MTEIPEHLLQRSQERRAALGLPGGEGGDAAPPPAGDGERSRRGHRRPRPRRSPPAPRPRSPPRLRRRPRRRPPYVQAARDRRKRIPFWAMPVIALLPVWAVIYDNSVAGPAA